MPAASEDGSSYEIAALDVARKLTVSLAGIHAEFHLTSAYLEAMRDGDRITECCCAEINSPRDGIEDALARLGARRARG
jgi:hypothetical protein